MNAWKIATEVKPPEDQDLLFSNGHEVCCGQFDSINRLDGTIFMRLPGSVDTHDGMNYMYPAPFKWMELPEP